MGKFKRIDTPIEGVCLIEPTVFGDNRGYFMETYSKPDFKEIGIDEDFVQDNQSKSKKGVLRGLHFQTENTQGKLVRVIKGRVFDVGVDLRRDSKTFNFPFSIYTLFSSVISNSPLSDGFIFLAISTTSLS